MSIENTERFVIEFADRHNNKHLHPGLNLLLHIHEQCYAKTMSNLQSFFILKPTSAIISKILLFFLR